MTTQVPTMPKTVRVIPPKPEFSGENRIDIRPKRVAAYCRVSTDKEQQEHSFETQKEMYTDMIMMKPNWQMAGIYADEGITGTIAKKRPDFMRMIEDCRKGKIEIFLRTLIQCPAHRSVENGLKQRLSADLNILPKAFFFMSWNDWMVTRTV